jgi:hypothetical protein
VAEKVFFRLLFYSPSQPHNYHKKKMQSVEHDGTIVQVDVSCLPKDVVAYIAHTLVSGNTSNSLDMQCPNIGYLPMLRRVCRGWVYGIDQVVGSIQGRRRNRKWNSKKVNLDPIWMTGDTMDGLSPSLVKWCYTEAPMLSAFSPREVVALGSVDVVKLGLRGYLSEINIIKEAACVGSKDILKCAGFSVETCTPARFALVMALLVHKGHMHMAFETITAFESRDSTKDSNVIGLRDLDHSLSREHLDTPVIEFLRNWIRKRREGIVGKRRRYKRRNEQRDEQRDEKRSSKWQYKLPRTQRRRKIVEKK